MGMPGSGSSSRSSKSSNSDSDMSSMPNMKEAMNSSRSNTKVDLNINAEPLDYLLLFVTGYLVIILALILPSISIMRYQPKEILAGKE
jgi:ABC-type lipoprotein release transport system permease subunit